ncbi:hypothetical protein D7V80_23175 [Corallococcus sp. CA054B]|uniref:hypothetical protein n=1 Tax=Corallococcus sp. CA054B TaxID=2316734 RepID=UPI000EA17F60|nr:hypothetical protein [Corallococcus sp. CA054B]RKG65498.1 hypothetical protein D7V80_23175 [Corallococcus sp. CA054B]
MPIPPGYERLEAIEDLLEEHRLLIHEQLATLSWQEVALDFQAEQEAKAKTPLEKAVAPRVALTLVAYQDFTRRLLLTYRHYEQGLQERLAGLTPEAP